MFCSKCGVPNNDEAKFCKDCGTQIGEKEHIAQHQVSRPALTVAVKQPKSVLFYILTPVFVFLGLIVFWGIVNIGSTEVESSPLLDFVNSALLPIAVGLTLLAWPIGIIYSINVNSKYYDGTIRCGNCDYIGPGKSGRSSWAKFTVWILLFIASPLITIIYYLVTHKYVCPKCNSTFIGLRNVNGQFSASKSGSGPLSIVLVVFIGIAVIGILAAVVLASLNDARDSGHDALTKQSLNNLRSEAELYYNTNDYSYEGFCDESVVTTSSSIKPLGFRCYDSASAYAVSATLLSGVNYCVDSIRISGIEIEYPLSFRTFCKTFN